MIAYSTDLPLHHLKFFFLGMVYSTVSLFSTIIFLVVATHLNKWKLDKKYRCALILWYLVFICVASMYELNIFGELNPPERHSSV